jgi:dGTPase
MINALVSDLIDNSAVNIARQAPQNVADVRRAPALIAFSPEFGLAQQEMKRFLRCHLYQHYQVLRMANKAQRIIDDLFSAFAENPVLLPPQYLADDGEEQARRAADYVSGMTDRYAIKEHRRLFAVGEI